MPSGSIENALLLLQPGFTAGNSDLSYYFASSVPSYAPGMNFNYSLTPGGPTPYTFQAGHFVGIGSFDNIAFASRLGPAAEIDVGVEARDLCDRAH